MTLSEALDFVYQRDSWNNPIFPYFVSGCEERTAYKALKNLKPVYQQMIVTALGHNPVPGEE